MKKIDLSIFAISTIVLYLIFYSVYYGLNKRHEKMVESVSLEISKPEYITPNDIVHYNELGLTDRLTPSTLSLLLQHRGIVYPEVFTKIAIQESGWDLEPKYRNNYFGFKCNIVSPYISDCYNEHSLFNDIDTAINFLREWINYSPPMPDEDPYQWLQRRGYNPNPNYYKQIKSINFL